MGERSVTQNPVQVLFCVRVLVVEGGELLSALGLVITVLGCGALATVLQFNSRDIESFASVCMAFTVRCKCLYHLGNIRQASSGRGGFCCVIPKWREWTLSEGGFLEGW